MIDDALTLALDAPTPEALWETASGFARSHGLDGIRYYFVSAGIIAAAGGAARYDPEEDDCPVGSEYRNLAEAAVYRRAFTHVVPFRWSELESLHWVTSRQVRDLHKVIEHSGDPLTLPVFGPRLRNGFFAVSAGRELCPDTPEAKRLQVCFQTFHMRWCKLTGERFDVEAPLADREREVMLWVARGKTNKEIAAILGCSANTVETHLRRVFAKLGVHERVTAAILSVGAGLIL